MRWSVRAGLVLLALAAGFARPARAEPPFSGTIFIDPDIITDSDPTAYQGLTPAGRGNRLMFDRRQNAFVTYNAYLFNARFSDGLTAEIQVNPEFGSAEAARAQAEKYAPAIGRLPTALRADVETVWIHRGTQPFGGGNNNLLIHTGQADLYVADGILEETFVHEASHTSLDQAHAESPGWLAAQAADGEFISTYARDNPTREDVAESFLPYLAVQHRADRISGKLADTIRKTMPNRIAYFDAQAFDLFPVIQPYRVADGNNDGRVDVADLGILASNFNENPADPGGRAGGDFNGDGTVNVTDLGLLATHYGEPRGADGATDAGPATFDEAMALPRFAELAPQLPEPAALGAAAVCGPSLLARRR